MLAIEGGRWILTGPHETTRLVLRAHRRSDLDDLVRFHGDAAVTRYIPWNLRDRQATAEALEQKLDQVSADVGEWLVLAVEHRATDSVIGEVLLKRGENHAEVGYVIAAAFQGAGYASEAVSALLAESSAALAVTRFTAVVDVRNDASLRLLEKLGFIVVGEPTREGDAMLVSHQLVIDRPT
jgi:RimJ/RimL family protein N-acetyltransferase